MFLTAPILAAALTSQCPGGVCPVPAAAPAGSDVPVRVYAAPVAPAILVARRPARPFRAILRPATRPFRGFARCRG